MKTEKVLKIFGEAVKTKGFKSISENVIEKGDYRFTYYGCYSDGTGFVGVEKKSECAFSGYVDFGSVDTLKVLKTRLGL